MDKEKKVIIKNLVITVLVICMFVGIILAFYGMLYAEKRKSIIKDGKMSAEKTADEVNDYMATCVDAIKLTAYSLNSMIKNKRSHEDIQSFLESQSDAVMGAIFENTTGEYGYICGQYHDGAGWVPDEDYEPTTRPWYLTAVAHPGDIVIVDPYVDQQTHSVMMSMAQTLSDGESVVALDLYLNRLQEITEDTVRSYDADVEFILDSQNMVIAHSDFNEVGKNYAEEEETLNARIIDFFENNDDDFYEFRYDGAHYIVYMEDIREGWKCVSVMDATSVFDPLKLILALTIIAVLVVIITISIIMMNANRRQLIAEKMSSQLSSTADIYVSLHEIDFLKDAVTEVRNNNKAEAPGREKTTQGDCQGQLIQMMREFSDEKDWDDTVLDFIDFSTLDRRMRGRNTITLEFLNSEKLWCRARFIVSDRMADGRITRAMFLVEDINDERTQREELINMSERALAASEAKSAFLSNMSHEIRTPINAVLGMNEMILRESNDENILAYSDNIRTAGNTLLGIINDILDFSKIEAGKLEIIPVNYYVSSLINDLVNMIRTRADAKGLRLILDMDPDIPVMLHGDEVRIKQVITNILTNAVKYTEKGSITFGISSEKPKNDPGAVILTVYVKDTGIGIKPEDMEKLFSEFERIEEERNRNVEGTGLGMNITKSLLEMMHSSLKVASIYGAGSRFSFRLKQRVVKWDPLGDYEKSYHSTLEERNRYKEKFVAPKAHVLVVDDNEMNLMVFKSLLKMTRVQVDSALSGDEGLKLTRKNKYDIIFLDHMMPDKDGIETLHELKNEQDNPNLKTPAVCLTANAISGARDKYVVEGFNDYLTKPIDSASLENMIMEYLPDELIEKISDEEADKMQSPKKEGIPEELIPLKDQKLIDISSGMKNNGTVEAYLATLRVYYESVDEKTAELEKLLSEEDFEDYTIKVHAIKSSLRIIGAGDPGEEAQRLEDSGKNRDYDYIRKHHEEFIKACISLKEPLKELFGRGEKTAKPAADKELMDEAYQEIRAAADAMDCDALGKVFEEMSGYTVPEEEAELWSALKADADALDYNGILQKINNKNREA